MADPASNKCLFAVYDLQLAPASFEFANFLVLARMQAEKENCGRLHIVIVPASVEIEDDDATASDDTDLQRRIRCILLPLTTMTDLTASVSLCQHRAEAGLILSDADGPIFPDGYAVDAPTASFLISTIDEAHEARAMVPSLRATRFAERIARNWLDPRCNGRHPVVITLRESDQSPAGNSNLEAWCAFAARLDPDRFLPIFIRDTAYATDTLPHDAGQAITCPIASADLHIRHALYEIAYLNLMIPGGPASLCLLNDHIRFLMFQPSAGPESSPDAESQYEPQLPFQRMVREPDDLNVIDREFQAMTARIDAIPKETASPSDPAQPEDPMQEALHLQATGRLDEAAALYQDIVTRTPDNADAWHRLGIIAHQAKDPDTAGKLIARAISIDPDRPDFHMSLAAVLRHNGRIEDAAKSLERAAALSPNEPGIHADLAEVFQVQGANTEARAAILKAIQINPNSSPLYERAARVLQELGHNDEAAAFYRRSLELRKAVRAEIARRLPEVPSISLTRR